MGQSSNYEDILKNQLIIPKKLLTNYKRLGLDEIDLIVIIQIHRFLSEGKEFPTLTEIASSLTIDEQQCALILRKLIQNHILIIESKINDDNQLSEVYSLEPLWQKIYVEEEDIEEEEGMHAGTIFILFEQEFGRPLSPFEIETINAWLDEDQIKPALIKAALREAVLMGKLNFKYIDRILQEWTRKGIHTVEQAREEAQKFRQYQTERKVEVTEGDPSRKDRTFYYNWLEDDD